MLEPLPAIAPGFITQLPEGNPFNTTLPVATKHVGCVITPTVGADGVTGWVLIITLADAEEVHPTELVTVNVRVPGVSPEIVILEPVPAIAPGLTIQLPVGNPFNSTEPVATLHVG